MTPQRAAAHTTPCTRPCTPSHPLPVHQHIRSLARVSTSILRNVLQHPSGHCPFLLCSSFSMVSRAPRIISVNLCQWSSSSTVVSLGMVEQRGQQGHQWKHTGSAHVSFVVLLYTQHHVNNWCFVSYKVLQAGYHITARHAHAAVRVLAA
jgi:hypothetical protein